MGTQGNDGGTTTVILDQFTPFELRDVELKLAETQADRNFFNRLIKELHYLHYLFRGRKLSYFVRAEGVLVALIEYADAPILLYQTFNGYANHEILLNSRFLIVQSVPNLASKVISHSLKIASRDWHQKTGIKPKLAVSYVDPSRGFDGTCYRAANWRCWGLSTGRLTKNNKDTGERTSRKLVFVRKLN